MKTKARTDARTDAKSAIKRAAMIGFFGTPRLPEEARLASEAAEICVAPHAGQDRMNPFLPIEYRRALEQLEERR